MAQIEHTIQVLIADLAEEHPVDTDAMRTLIQIGTPAIPYLIEALKRQDTWLNAAEVLARIGQPAIPALLHILSEPPYSNFAFHALTHTKGNALLAFLEAFESEDPETRGWAILGIGDLRDIRAISALRRALTDHDPSLRRYAIEAYPRNNWGWLAGRAAIGYTLT